jgi:exosome complex component RRP42
MILSSTERSYLYESLCSTPPIRPDGRSIKQFRPIQSQVDFLESSNGSAKITLSDGSECIVSVKAKVVEKSLEPELVSVDVEVAGHREDSSFILNLTSTLQSLYSKHIPREALNLTSKFAFKIFIDILVISNYSHPLTLMSFATYLALKHTYLPKITSSVDDKEIEEQPTFHDYEFVKLEVAVPIIFTVVIIGENYIIDPNAEEMEVSDNGLIVSWFNGKPISPMENVKLNDTNVKSVKPELILKSVDLISSIASTVISALDAN